MIPPICTAPTACPILGTCTRKWDRPLNCPHRPAPFVKLNVPDKEPELSLREVFRRDVAVMIELTD